MESQQQLNILDQMPVDPSLQSAEETFKQMSKDFIKQQKNAVTSYIADILVKGDKYRIEVTKTSKIERYTLLKEDNELHDFDSSEMELDFLEDMFDLEEGEEEEETDKVYIPDNNQVITAWKQQYATPEDDDIGYGTDVDDLGLAEDLNDPLARSVADNNNNMNITYEDIIPEVENTFWHNYKVVFDYFRFSESKGVMNKCIYGDEDQFSEISLLVNRIFNFNKTDKTFRDSNYGNEGNHAVVIKSYEEDNTFLTSTIKFSDNEVIRHVFLDKNEDIDITYYVTKQNKNVPIIPSNNLLPGLRYVKQTLVTNSTKEKQVFKLAHHMRTLVLPKVKTFEKFLNLSYIKDCNYEIVDTANKLIDYTEKYLLTCPDTDVLGYDAETTGLEARKWVKKPDLVVTHSFSWDDGCSMIVPIRMLTRKNIRPEEAHEILKPVFETKNILAHNGAADVRFLLPDGIYLNLVEDTMHLIRMIIPFIIKAMDAGGLNRALDTLCKEAFGYDMIDLYKYVFKPAGVDFNFALLNDDYMISYGCPDTDLMRRLWKGLRPKLDPKREYAYKQLVEYSKAMAILAAYPGIGVDTEKMKKARQVSINTVNKVQSLIYEITGEPRETFKLSAPKQISNYIYNKMGAPTEYAKKTDKGELSADKSVMAALSQITLPTPSDLFKPSMDIYDEEGELVVSHKELNKLKYPFCKLHRIQADKTKDITAFFNGILNNAVEGVYYPDFRVAQTDTYRDTDRVQITKKGIKYYLGAYTEEYAFLSMDYATEEFRITANLSTDQSLIDMLKDPESDAHTMVAAEMYDMEPSEIDKSLRDPIKSCNFGIIYGMKVRRLTMQLKKTEHPTNEDLEEIQAIYDLYLYKRAEMLAPLEDSRQHVRDTAWIENAVGGWMLYPQVIDVPDFIRQVFDFTTTDIPKANFDIEKKAKNMGLIMNRAGNFPIQSLAAFQLKDGMIKFYNLLEQYNLLHKVFVPLSVHDEIGVIYHKSVDPYLLLKLVHQSFYSRMEYVNKPIDKMAPLFIGVGFGTSWGNSKSDLAELPVQLQEDLISEYNQGTHPVLTAHDDHAAHFSERISTFLAKRICKMFHDMLENKHFMRNEMLYRINQNVFLGKKMDEIFKTNKTREVEKDGKKVKQKYVDVDQYIQIMCDHLGMDMEELLIEDGPIIEKEKKSDDDMTEFFFQPKLHEIVTVHDKHLQVDVRGLPNVTLKSLIDYFWTLHNPDYNYHNKTVKFIVAFVNGMYDMRTIEGMQILGIPADFADVITHILVTGKFEGNSKQTTLRTEPQDPLLLFDHQNKYLIFDVQRAHKHNENMVADLSKILNLHVHPSPSVPYRVWLINNDSYLPTDLYVDGIPNSLLEDMRKLYNRYDFICKM